MGKRRDLLMLEKTKIVQLLHDGESSLEISKLLGRDHRTIKKFIEDMNKKRQRTTGKGFKGITARDKRRLTRTVKKYPLLSSAEIFDKADVTNVKRDTRCRILRTLGTFKKAVGKPPLNKGHMEKRLAWATENIKIDFSKVIFTDESRMTLDGPDGWSRGWVSHGNTTPTRLRRQQGGGGIMIWAGIVNDRVIGPFKVDDGVKLNSDNYCQLLERTFFQWYKSQKRIFKRDSVLMQDNAPSHAAKSTKEFLARKGFSGKKLMTWPPSSPDLNPIENLWSLVKRELYKGGKQYQRKNELWEAIKIAMTAIKPGTIKSLTASMDKRLVTVLENKGGYVNM